jgi:hypothetical protein
MPTDLKTDEMKGQVRSHFEDFVNNRKPEVIRTNMTADFYDHDGLAASQRTSRATKR